MTTPMKAWLAESTFFLLWGLTCITKTQLLFWDLRVTRITMHNNVDVPCVLPLKISQMEAWSWGSMSNSSVQCSTSFLHNFCCHRWNSKWPSATIINVIIITLAKFLIASTANGCICFWCLLTWFLTWSSIEYQAFYKNWRGRMEFLSWPIKGLKKKSVLNWIFLLFLIGSNIYQLMKSNVVDK